jgi:hypothetical protein
MTTINPIIETVTAELTATCDAWNTLHRYLYAVQDLMHTADYPMPAAWGYLPGDYPPETVEYRRIGDIVGDLPHAEAERVLSVAGNALWAAEAQLITAGLNS